MAGISLEMLEINGFAISKLAGKWNATLLLISLDEAVLAFSWDWRLDRIFGVIKSGGAKNGA